MRVGTHPRPKSGIIAASRASEGIVRMTAADVTVDPARRTARIELPAPEVLLAALDNDQIAEVLGMARVACEKKEYEAVLDMTAQVYRKVWEMAAFAGFLMGREAARRMVQRESGTIIFTGATASIRGGNGFSAFSSAKGALRMLAQSMARELGPKNIHVAHVIIDGGIDTAFIRGIRPDFEDAKASDGILSPDAIALQYVALHKQHRSAWTHEMDLRPWSENF